MTIHRVDMKNNAALASILKYSRIKGSVAYCYSQNYLFDLAKAHAAGELVAK